MNIALSPLGLGQARAEAKRPSSPSRMMRKPPAAWEKR